MTDEELDKILKQVNEKRNAQNLQTEQEAPALIETPKEVETPSVEEIKEEPMINLNEVASDEPKEEIAPENVNDDLVFANDLAEHKNNVEFSEYAEEYDEENSLQDKKKKKNKKIIVAVIAVVLVVAIGLGVYFGFFYNKKSEDTTTETKATTTETTTQVATDLNPLTGESGFNMAYANKRPLAVVVENEYSTAAVKPQWGLSDADIVLEGESEFSTRLLLFWADYSKVPAQVGPTRSARPPFIHFSQLFDSVFIHAGLSHSAGDYVGADEVFENEGIDHINLLSFSENGTYFGRDYSRTSTVEHTGYLNGTNVEKLLEEQSINTTLNTDKFTALKFNTEAKNLSDNVATDVSFTWSSNCPKKGSYTYDATTKKYTTTDFDSKYGTSNVQWENLIFLLDNTEYVVKENYKGSGSSETYCNYDLSGGKGLVCSQGTSVEITWGVTDGKLWMKDSSGNDITLNPGKSYIGYGSSNHGGSYTVNLSN